jgi:uncharacterized protein YeaC (DUF1315 family)
VNEATLEKMLAALTPEIVAAMKLAIEISKWPDGRRLTDEQRATCLQAIIAWEHKHLPEEQRTGYIDKGTKGEGDVCNDNSHHHEEEPVKFMH